MFFLKANNVTLLDTDILSIESICNIYYFICTLLCYISDRDFCGNRPHFLCFNTF